jgi:hypothetical protein
MDKDFLNEILEYRDGLLYWKKNRGNVKAGSLAGCHAFKGYWVVRINRKNHYYHRVIYMMHTGEMPTIVDHIDGNPSNNKFENLRPADYASNGWNQKIQSNNKSGVKGVCWNKKQQKWVVHCMNNGKNNYLGCFSDLQKAKKVVEEFRFNSHNEFARNG